MSTVAARVERGEERGQVEVTVREAARIAGVSTKQVRRWIAAGEVRATKRQEKHGPTWCVEASSLPARRVSLDTAGARSGEGSPVDGRGSGDGRGVGSGERTAEVVASLLAVVREKDGALEERRRELEAAAGRIGFLEGEGQQMKALAARAESLQQERSELQGEAHRQGLELEAERGRVARLLRAVRLRTWAVGILLLGFAVVVAALLAR